MRGRQHRGIWEGLPKGKRSSEQFPFLPTISLSLGAITLPTTPKFTEPSKVKRLYSTTVMAPLNRELLNYKSQRRKVTWSWAHVWACPSVLVRKTALLWSRAGKAASAGIRFLGGVWCSVPASGVQMRFPGASICSKSVCFEEVNEAH